MKLSKLFSNLPGDTIHLIVSFSNDLWEYCYNCKKKKYMFRIHSKSKHVQKIQQMIHNKIKNPPYFSRYALLGDSKPSHFTYTFNIPYDEGSFFQYSVSFTDIWIHEKKKIQTNAIFMKFLYLLDENEHILQNDSRFYGNIDHYIFERGWYYDHHVNSISLGSVPYWSKINVIYYFTPPNEFIFEHHLRNIHFRNDDSVENTYIIDVSSDFFSSLDDAIYSFYI